MSIIFKLSVLVWLECSSYLCRYINDVGILILCIDQCWTGWCNPSHGGLVEMAGSWMDQKRFSRVSGNHHNIHHHPDYNYFSTKMLLPLCGLCSWGMQHYRRRGRAITLSYRIWMPHHQPWKPLCRHPQPRAVYKTAGKLRSEFISLLFQLSQI